MKMRLCHFPCHSGNQKSHSEIHFFYKTSWNLVKTFSAHGLISLSRPALTSKILFQSCFLVTIFPLVALLHFLHLDTHTTHNSSNRSDEGLKLETSAFKLFRWPINLINSINNTKLPCYTLLPIATQLHSFFGNLPLSIILMDVSTVSFVVHW